MRYNRDTVFEFEFGGITIESKRIKVQKHQPTVLISDRVYDTIFIERLVDFFDEE